MIKDAMIDMQLLLRGVWRFHSDEGREFMAFRDKLNVTCCLERERPSSCPPGVVRRLRQNWNIPQCAEEVWIPSLCKEFLLVGTGGCRKASKLQPSAMTERLRKCSRERLFELATSVPFVLRCWHEVSNS